LFSNATEALLCDDNLFTRRAVKDLLSLEYQYQVTMTATAGATGYSTLDGDLGEKSSKSKNPMD
jgi:hypothetical protein